MPLYPAIEPHAQGMLDVGDGQSLYWEECGRPDGKPAVVLHGGPGSGCAPWMRRLFDPAAYRVVLFDQRGCGRSTPHAGDPGTSLEANTTHHLLADMERLRAHLGIARWLLFGASWGSTLALAYAERHPERVAQIVLLGVTTTRRAEIEWLYRRVAPLLPQAWARFCAGAPEAEREGEGEGDLVEAYHRRLHDPDPAVCDRAARDWHAWEAASLSADPEAPPPASWGDARHRLGRARIVTHYFRHAAWLEEGVLLRHAHRLAGIPGVLVQGRLDLAAPLATGWELSRAWPDAELVVVGGAGHSAGDPGLVEAVVAATDRFARHDR